MNILIHKARLVGSTARRAAVTALRWTGRRLQAIWSAHRRLIDTNAAYAAAMAAGAANLVRQISLERFLVALVSACLAIYIAIRGRGLAWGQWLAGTRDDRDDWDDESPRDLRLFRAPRWGNS